jgi:aspartate aminotransferase
MSTQVAQGWAFPDAPLQHAVADLEKVSIDIPALQHKRDRMHGALTQWGYTMTKPAGTFYLWGKAPGGDAVTFASILPISAFMSCQVRCSSVPAIFASA